MIEGRRVLAVVPARGGSKGIPLKNLRQVAGRSLVAHAAAVAAGVPEVDRRVVSTDHERIAAEAEAHGLAAPFRRPGALSGDRVGDWEVLEHALREMERIDGCTYDIVVMLQPTSPLRTADNVRATIRKLVEGGHDAVWTVSPTDLKYHPLKQLSVEDGRMDFFDPRGAAIIARQQLAPVYHRNGVAYAFTRGCLLEHGAIMGPDTGAVVIEGAHVSIDTLEDIEKVEAHWTAR
ncbi:acylneuraminate cytidylyltransferase family protein [Roseicyclus sp.]|uniref:acylneuraminate cytidylyltransferase family protein n=1 Tax=Roseicyclus sp. TaxID=1914329 RepID=UPI003FA080E6